MFLVAFGVHVGSPSACSQEAVPALLPSPLPLRDLPLPTWEHLQYRRSRRREVMSQHLPPRVLEMRRLKPKTDSLKVWLESGLCSVSAQPGHDDLSISLTEAWPVPIPGHAEEE